MLYIWSYSYEYLKMVKPLILCSLLSLYRFSYTDYFSLLASKTLKKIYTQKTTYIVEVPF